MNLIMLIASLAIQTETGTALRQPWFAAEPRESGPDDSPGSSGSNQEGAFVDFLGASSRNKTRRCISAFPLHIFITLQEDKGKFNSFRWPVVFRDVCQSMKTSRRHVDREPRGQQRNGRYAKGALICR